MESHSLRWFDPPTMSHTQVPSEPVHHSDEYQTVELESSSSSPPQTSHPPPPRISACQRLWDHVVESVLAFRKMNINQRESTELAPKLLPPQEHQDKLQP